MGDLIKGSKEATRLQGSLTEAEGEASKLRVEVTRLQELLVKVKGKASIIEHHVFNMAIKVIKTY